MFYSQPLATRFGTDLIGHIDSNKWTHLDIAVAWARASGMAHLEPALTRFLQRGHHLTIIVGVDLDNTSKEGLESLLSLVSKGDASIFVHHNEGGAIFHPKLYLFRNSTRATLIVGSNNITEAGLFRNTEAGLELETDIGAEIITSSINALGAWSDTTLGLARKLDSAFLSELVVNGYVKDEATVRDEMAARRAAAQPKAGPRKKLFGTLSVAAPTRPNSTTATTKPSPSPTKSTQVATKGKTAYANSIGGSAVGQVLLMRVRTARGTQVQIPLAVMRTPFFTAATQVYSVANGITRGIHPTHAARAKDGANPNTLKLEMPETSTMSDPVVRFERTPTGIQYEVYDSTSTKGRAIMRALENGRTTTPPLTTLTTPSTPARATWWRFI